VELCAYALNFGTRASPLVFTKHMRALVKYLRQHAIGVVIYLDDLAFVIEGSQAAALRARDFVEKTLCRAGLQRHPSKGQFQVPSQVLHDHLGYEVNIPHNLLRVSSIDMYNNDVGKESAQKFMKQTGDLKAATLYFAS
jgi:hypothetical protein